MLNASMADNTRHTYKTAFYSFNHFSYITGYLLRGYIYIYKIQGLKDITKSFIVTKLLEGATRRTPRQDTRAPKTLQMLLTLLQALDKTRTSNYEVHHFEATFCLAFFFCF